MRSRAAAAKKGEDKDAESSQPLGTDLILPFLGVLLALYYFQSVWDSPSSRPSPPKTP